MEATVETVREGSLCPWCGEECRRVRAYRTLRVRDIPTRLSDTVLVRRRRFECDGCGRTHIETHPAIEGKFTAQYARQLTEAVNTSRNIGAVALAAGVSWSTIGALVNKKGEREITRRRALPCRVLLVDETAVGKGHQYMTVLYDGEEGHALAMLPGRTKTVSDQVLQKPRR